MLIGHTPCSGVVAELDLICITVLEPEAYPPLVVHGDRVLPGPITRQGMKAVPWRHAKVTYLHGGMDRLKLAERPTGHVSRHFAGAARPEQLFGFTVGESLDHARL